MRLYDESIRAQGQSGICFVDAASKDVVSVERSDLISEGQRLIFTGQSCWLRLQRVYLHRRDVASLTHKGQLLAAAALVLCKLTHSKRVDGQKKPPPDKESNSVHTAFLALSKE